MSVQRQPSPEKLPPPSPAQRAEAKRILDRAARRILAERLAERRELERQVARSRK